jgi:hypothetical protein
MSCLSIYITSSLVELTIAVYLSCAMTCRVECKNTSLIKLRMKGMSSLDVRISESRFVLSTGDKNSTTAGKT